MRSAPGRQRRRRGGRSGTGNRRAPRQWRTACTRPRARIFRRVDLIGRGADGPIHGGVPVDEERAAVRREQRAEFAQRIVAQLVQHVEGEDAVDRAVQGARALPGRWLRCSAALMGRSSRAPSRASRLARRAHRRGRRGATRAISIAYVAVPVPKSTSVAPGGRSSKRDQLGRRDVAEALRIVEHVRARRIEAVRLFCAVPVVFHRQPPLF